MKNVTNGLIARVVLSFNRMKNPDLLSFTRNVVSSIAGKTAYPTPNPPLATITAAADVLEKAVNDAAGGGKLLILQRNAAREALLVLLRQLAAYVQGNCNEDVVTLVSSGFDAARAPSPIGNLPAPGNARLNLTDSSGELAFRFDAVKGAANYSIQTAASAGGPWNDEGLSSSTRYLLDGLTPGQVYWARSCANGTAGPSDWSNPATAMAV